MKVHRLGVAPGQDQAGCLAFLDPFVRLHRIDENVSGDVAQLLAFLRVLQATLFGVVTVRLPRFRCLIA